MTVGFERHKRRGLEKFQAALMKGENPYSPHGPDGNGRGALSLQPSPVGWSMPQVRGVIGPSSTRLIPLGPPVNTIHEPSVEVSPGKNGDPATTGKAALSSRLPWVLVGGIITVVAVGCTADKSKQNTAASGSERTTPPPGQLSTPQAVAVSPTPVNQEVAAGIEVALTPEIESDPLTPWDISALTENGVSLPEGATWENLGVVEQNFLNLLRTLYSFDGEGRVGDLNAPLTEEGFGGHVILPSRGEVERVAHNPAYPVSVTNVDRMQIVVNGEAGQADPENGANIPGGTIIMWNGPVDYDWNESLRTGEPVTQEEALQFVLFLRPEGRLVTKELTYPDGEVFLTVADLNDAGETIKYLDPITAKWVAPLTDPERVVNGENGPEFYEVLNPGRNGDVSGGVFFQGKKLPSVDFDLTGLRLKNINGVPTYIDSDGKPVWFTAVGADGEESGSWVEAKDTSSEAFIEKAKVELEEGGYTHFLTDHPFEGNENLDLANTVIVAGYREITSTPEVDEVEVATHLQEVESRFRSLVGSNERDLLDEVGARFAYVTGVYEVSTHTKFHKGEIDNTSYYLDLLVKADEQIERVIMPIPVGKRDLTLEEVWADSPEIVGSWKINFQDPDNPSKTEDGRATSTILRGSSPYISGQVVLNKSGGDKYTNGLVGKTIVYIASGYDYSDLIEKARDPNYNHLGRIGYIDEYLGDWNSIPQVYTRFQKENFRGRLVGGQQRLLLLEIREGHAGIGIGGQGVNVEMNPELFYVLTDNFAGHP